MATAAIRAAQRTDLRLTATADSARAGLKYVDNQPGIVYSYDRSPAVRRRPHRRWRTGDADSACGRRRRPHRGTAATVAACHSAICKTRIHTACSTWSICARSACVERHGTTDCHSSQSEPTASDIQAASPQSSLELHGTARLFLLP